jgi:hypothetical protein
MFGDRTSQIVLAMVALVVIAATGFIAILTITGSSEYAQFAAAMVVFVALLIGSYWYVMGTGGGHL